MKNILHDFLDNQNLSIRERNALVIESISFFTLFFVVANSPPADGTLISELLFRKLLLLIMAGAGTFASFLALFANGQLWEPPFWRLKWHKWRLKTIEGTIESYQDWIDDFRADIEERQKRIRELEGKR